MNNKLAIRLFLFLFVLSFTGCSKDDIFDKFPPEILYKRYEYGSDGTGSWKVSPDAVETTLETESTEWTIRARVSAPNELEEVQLLIISGTNEQLLERFTDFTSNPNVTEIEYVLTDITSQVTIRLVAIDKRGMTTQRDFTIKY